MLKKIFKLFIPFTILYFMLFVTDYGLKKYFFATSFYNKEVAPIIKKRNIENKKIKIQAINDGYVPLINPILWYQNDKLLEIAKSKNIVPLTSQPYTKVYLCNEGYGLVKYTTDRFGLRNPENAWGEGKKIEVIIVGDSIANGACVKEKYSVAGQLRKNYNVINLSSNGNAAAHYASLIHVFTKYFSPKKALVLFLYSNDFEEKNNDFYRFIISKYINENTEYFNTKENSSVKPKQLSQNVLELFNLALPVVDKYLDYQLGYKKYKESLIFTRIPRVIKRHYTLPEYRNILLRKKKYSLPENIKLSLEKLSKNCGINSLNNKNCKPIIVFIPASEYWRKSFYKNNYYRDAINNLILNSNSDIKFYDTSKDLEALGMKAYSPLGVHLSIESNEVISNKLKLMLIND